MGWKMLEDLVRVLGMVELGPGVGRRARAYLSKTLWNKQPLPGDS